MLRVYAPNAAVVRNDVSNKPFGLNMNTFTDGDGNRSAGATPLRDALAILHFTGKVAPPDCTINLVANNGFENGIVAPWQATFDGVNF